MLLTIATTYQPATDLGYLLHKNPAKAQSFRMSFGSAHVFYPEAGEEQTTVALLLEIDPIGLVRTRRGPSGTNGLLDQYVNDRPYVASSFLSVAIGEVFRSAMGGRSADRPQLAQTAMPLTASMPALPCRGGDALLRSLFEPLGYEVTARRLRLDEVHPEWGDSPYFSVTIAGNARLCDLLTHLYVLIPVLDKEKHYWVGEDEVDKLLRHGGDWLAAHPQREAILRRYLRHQKSLARLALEQLVADEDTDDIPAGPVPEGQPPAGETALEAPMSLNEQRLQAVARAVQQLAAESVIDLGCGEGRLLGVLLKQRALSRIVGLDVSMRTLEQAAERLNLERLPAAQRARLTLLHGALTYRDTRLSGFDVATVIEVIEHLDAARLAAFERVLFEFARPRAVVMTTPNAEFNVRFASLPAGQFRHPDHRFEWSRAQFEDWAGAVAGRHGYTVAFSPIGPLDQALGAPTQMAVFSQSTT